MKKLLFICLIIVPIFSFAQQEFHYHSGGTIYNEDNVKFKPREIRSLFENNTEILKLYNAGRFKKTVGNLLFYGGIATVIIKHYSMIQKYSNNGNSNFNPNTIESNNIMYYVGAGMILVSIPIKIGYTKKIKQAVELMTATEEKKKSTGFNIESSSFLVNSNGMGISITF
ncbi:MAG: hypothetical protein H7239_05290 [Flavobacterium sp.]|nr:hypothetical protein [Flavobacterium sp.]